MPTCTSCIKNSLRGPETFRQEVNSLMPLNTTVLLLDDSSDSWLNELRNCGGDKVRRHAVKL